MAPLPTPLSLPVQEVNRYGHTEPAPLSGAQRRDAGSFEFFSWGIGVREVCALSFFVCTASCPPRNRVCTLTVSANYIHNRKGDLLMADIFPFRAFRSTDHSRRSSRSTRPWSRTRCSTRTRRIRRAKWCVVVLRCLVGVVGRLSSCRRLFFVVCARPRAITRSSKPAPRAHT